MLRRMAFSGKSASVSLSLFQRFSVPLSDTIFRTFLRILNEYKDKRDNGVITGTFHTRKHVSVTKNCQKDGIPILPDNFDKDYQKYQSVQMNKRIRQ